MKFKTCWLVESNLRETVHLLFVLVTIHQKGVLEIFKKLMIPDELESVSTNIKTCWAT